MPYNPLYPHQSVGSSKVSKTQILVHKMLQKLLPGHSATINYSYKYVNDQGFLIPFEFDVSSFFLLRNVYLDKIFIPSLSLAIEYQGEQHYIATQLHGSPEIAKKSDQRKAEISKQQGVTLVHIPFWWDKSVSTTYI
jgi:hypothetical protein